MGDHAIVIEAANSEGPDHEEWTIRVPSRKDFDSDGDVDQADFGLFQHCVSGTGIGLSQGCGSTDLDSDGDVDSIDFSLFWPCMTGAGEPPGC